MLAIIVLVTPFCNGGMSTNKSAHGKIPSWKRSAAVASNAIEILALAAALGDTYCLAALCSV